jgi:hypothetical protein
MKRTSIIAKLVLPFLGIGSLIWFLLRVIPKPGRAAYPCMRVAAPLASTFVLWVLGAATSFLCFKKARAHFFRSRYLTAALCIAAGGIAGALLLSSPSHLSFAATKAAGPIGEAKGANPGRVVWVYDSAATPWRGLGDGHWWESGHTSQSVVDRMLSRSLRELGGKATDSSAWDTLFRYYNRVHGRGPVGYTKGEKIAIKINLSFCTHMTGYSCVDTTTYHLKQLFDYMHTSPQVVRALLRQLVYVAGVDQADISVGDPVAYYPFEYYDSCHAEFPNVHYIDYAGKYGRTKAEPSSIPVYWSSRPTGVKQDYVPKHYSEATYLINLANMKSHSLAGLTLCAKNHYGSLRLPLETGYYSLHESLAATTPQTGSYRAAVDLMGHAHVGGKTLLYLIDGLYAGNHQNDTVPHKWPVSASPFNGGWTSSMFASQDPVAIECVLFDVFQFDNDPYQYQNIPGAQDYLLEAAQAGNPPSGTFYDPNHATATQRLQSLGVYEHWNNAIDRQYSRNLSSGSGIELVFIDGATSAVRLMGPPGAGISGFSMHAASNSGQVEFSVPRQGRILLSIFDCRGRTVEKILDRFMAAGVYRLDMSHAAPNTMTVSSGSYVIVLYRQENGKTVRVAACPVIISRR